MHCRHGIRGFHGYRVGHSLGSALIYAYEAQPREASRRMEDELDVLVHADNVTRA